MTTALQKRTSCRSGWRKYTCKTARFGGFLMIVSLRKMKNRNIFFSLSEQTFISRYIKLNKLITLIKSTDKDQQVRQVTLTRYEWDIYYLYFKIDNKRILHTLLKRMSSILVTIKYQFLTSLKLLVIVMAFTFSRHLYS